MIEKAYIVPHPPLIVPEIGKGEEKTIQDTIDNYKKYAKEIVELNPDTIIITTPHSVMYRDYFHISPGDTAYGNFQNFYAPQVGAKVNYDEELRDEIIKNANSHGIPAGTLGEMDPNLDHATLIPLYFIQQENPDFLKDKKIIRIGLSGLPLEEHFKLGKDISKGPYGYKKEGPEFDKMFAETVKNGDLEEFKNYDENFCNKASECGLRSFVILAGALDDYDYSTSLDSYEDPFGVGYGCAEINIEGKDNE